MTEAERCRPGLFLFPEAGVDVLSWGILFPAENGKAGHWKFNVRL
jgi:hypothetical protein